jgi:hypothetical protein
MEPKKFPPLKLVAWPTTNIAATLPDLGGNQTNASVIENIDSSKAKW